MAQINRTGRRTEQDIGFTMAVELLFARHHVCRLLAAAGAIAADTGASLLVIFNGMRLIGGPCR